MEAAMDTLALPTPQRYQIQTSIENGPWEPIVGFSTPTEAGVAYNAMSPDYAQRIRIIDTLRSLVFFQKGKSRESPPQPPWIYADDYILIPNFEHRVSRITGDLLAYENVTYNSWCPRCDTEVADHRTVEAAREAAESHTCS
jgi:hypothetical protein